MKIPQTTKTKYLTTSIVISLILLFSLIATIGYVRSIYVGDVTEVWVQPPFSEASYIVGQYNSTYYYAKNCTTGNYDFLSTNASYVIQSCVNAVTNGSIFIKGGIYEGTSNFLSIISKSNLIIEGEGNTVFKRSNNDPNYNSNFFILIRSSSNIWLKNLIIDGNKANNERYHPTTGADPDPWQYGDNLFVDYGCSHITFEHCTFQNALKYGTQVAVSTTSNYSNDIHFLRCFYTYNAWNGVLFGDSYDIEMSECTLEHSSDVGISVHGCWDVTISNCLVRDIDQSDGYINGGVGVAGTRWGIGIEAADSAWKTECLIIGCTITGCNFGIRVGGQEVDYNGRTVIDGCWITRNNIGQTVGTPDKAYGVMVKGSLGHVDIRNSYIANNCYEVGTDISYNVYVDDPDVTITDNFISQKDISASGKAINIGINTLPTTDGGGDDVFIQGNTIEQSKGSGRSGIYMRYADNIRIYENFIDTNANYGIEILSGTNIIVELNLFSDNVAGAISDSGTATRFFRNIGYVTENSGTATITASTNVTFNHGMNKTPTHVTCGFKTTGYGSWIWSANSTQITITVTVSGTYDLSWYAEYKP